MAVAHLVWLLLALLLTYALLGLAQNAEVLQLPVEVFFHAHDFYHTTIPHPSEMAFDYLLIYALFALAQDAIAEVLQLS